MPEIVDNVEYLAKTIGPRPAGTEEEQQAALYIADQLKKDAGLPTQIEDFGGVYDTELTGIICGAAAVLAALLGLAVPALGVLAVILALLAVICYAAENFGKPLLSRILGRGVSQNVVAKYETANADTARRRRKIILVAHYDSGKVRGELTNPVISFLRQLHWAGLIGMGLVALGLIFCDIFLLNSTGFFHGFFTLLAIVGAILSLIPLGISVLHKTAPYNEGANCNASGVAVLLEVARRIGNGRISEEEIAQRQAVVHGEEAARDADLVPVGAEIVYESQKLQAPDIAPTSEAARLAAAKAAIAALTGKPVPGAAAVSDISNNLVQVKDQPVAAPNESETHEWREETREAFQGSGAVAGEFAENEEEAQAEPAPAFEEQAAGEDAQAPNDAAEAAVQPEMLTGMAAGSAAVFGAAGTGSVPSWFKRAQENAKKSGKVDDEPVVARSRFAEALEAQEAAEAARAAAAEPDFSRFFTPATPASETEPATAAAPQAAEEDLPSLDGLFAPTGAAGAAASEEGLPARSDAASQEPAVFAQSTVGGLAREVVGEPNQAIASEADVPAATEGEGAFGAEDSKAAAEFANEPAAPADAESAALAGTDPEAEKAAEPDLETVQPAAQVGEQNEVSGLDQATIAMPVVEVSKIDEPSAASPVATEAAASEPAAEEASAPAAEGTSQTESVDGAEEPPVKRSRFADAFEAADALSTQADEPAQAEAPAQADEPAQAEAPLDAQESEQEQLSPEQTIAFDALAVGAALPFSDSAVAQSEPEGAGIADASTELFGLDLTGSLDAIAKPLTDNGEMQEQQRSELHKQRAPLAEAAVAGQEAGAKSLLTNLPSISVSMAPIVLDGAEEASDAQDSSRRVQDLRASLPSLSGLIGKPVVVSETEESEASVVNSAGSFAPASATGAFAPIGDELLQDVAPEDIYIEDADDSTYDETHTETGAFAGPGYVDMPKSRLRRWFDRITHKNDADEETPQEWLDVDDDFDARTVGAERGGWESFRQDQPSPEADVTQKIDALPEEWAQAAQVQDAVQDASQEVVQGFDDPFEDEDAYAGEDGYAGDSSQDEYNNFFQEGANDEDHKRFWHGGAFSFLRSLEERVGLAPAAEDGEEQPEGATASKEPFDFGEDAMAGFDDADISQPAESVETPEPAERADQAHEQGEAADEALAAADDFGVDAHAGAAGEQDQVDEEIRQIYQFRNPDVNTDVWFVALGSELAGHAGIQAFLAEHADELRGAMVVDLGAMGRGELSYVQSEGLFKTVQASSRLKRYLNKVARATGLAAEKTTLTWDDSAASVSIKNGVQGIHLVGMEGNLPAGMGQANDVSEEVEEETMLANADFVMELIKNI